MDTSSLPARAYACAILCASRRRHLFSGGSTVAFTVQTTQTGAASKIGARLNSTAELATALLTPLQAAFPSLSGLVASPPTSSSLVLAAVPCVAGTFLDSNTQSCTNCSYGLVSMSAASAACVTCQPGNAWVNASLCAACPANAVTSPTDPGMCACTFGYYDTLFGANSIAPVCGICPAGGQCTTGFVGASEGYWRESTTADTFYRCREERCLAEELVGPLSAAPARRRHLLLSRNLTSNCVPGNTGPLCAVCLPGYSMQSGACAPCDPSQAYANWSKNNKTMLLVGSVVVGIVGVLLLLFQPLFPYLERRLNAAGARTSMAMAKAKAKIAGLKRGSASHDAAAHGRDDSAPHAVPIAVMAAAAAATGAVAFAGAASSGSAVLSLEEVEEVAEEVEEEAANDLMETIDAVSGFWNKVSKVASFVSEAWSRYSGTYGKVLLSFYQIVSTFLKSLSVPWPRSFVTVFARISVVNLQLVQLPKTACLNPNPSYYTQCVCAHRSAQLMHKSKAWAACSLFLQVQRIHVRPSRLPGLAGNPFVPGPEGHCAAHTSRRLGGGAC